MSLRLRQRDAYAPAREISGTATYNGRVIATYSDSLGSIDGESQSVLDHYLGRLPVRGTLKSRNTMPPLNSVTMSRVSTIVPSETWTYITSTPPYLYRLTGGPLSAAPLTAGILPKPDYRPPTRASELELIQVSTGESSYLLQRALSKASTAEFDFGVTVGEVAETAAFLAKPLGGIAKLSTAAFAGARAIYRHGSTTCLQIAKAATERQKRRLLQTTRKHPIDTSLRIVDESANHWLAYKFGVMPLIDDIGKALDFKEKNVQRLLGLRTSRVKGYATTSTELRKFTNQVFGYHYFDVNALVRKEDRHYCGLYWLNRINAPLLNFMEGLGFAPWHLPGLAYELIPLSFVVDRFIDIKSFVRGNIGSLSKDILGSYCTRKVWTKYVYNVDHIRYGDFQGSATQLSIPMKDSSALYERMCRVVNPDRPTFPVTNPHWREQLVADATNLSLIWGRLRTHVGKLI